MQALSIPTVPFDEIRLAINGFIADGDEINAASIKTEDEFTQSVERRKSWEESVREFLQRSFSTGQYKMEFEQCDRPFFVPGGPGRSPLPIFGRVQSAKQRTSGLIQWLRFNLAIWEQCELIKGEPVDTVARARFTMQQRLNFLLEKLAALDDGNSYYPVGYLLQANGILFKSDVQLLEMAGLLEDNGYVERQGGIGEEVSARITVSGQLYVEDRLSPYKEDYSGISDDRAVVSEMIDQVKEKLSAVGAGQEVLFDELEDLRALYGKLSKKNWGELLKGKLVDLALDRVISKETFGFIFTFFTGHELKLLS